MEENRIFLVEDDADDRSIVQYALDSISAANVIRFAHNGIEGLQMLDNFFKEGTLPRLIIIDVNIPKMTGVELLGLLKNDIRFKMIPVVIYSTSINPFEREKCISLGAHSYINKPISYNESIEVVKKFMELSEE